MRRFSGILLVLALMGGNDVLAWSTATASAAAGDGARQSLTAAPLAADKVTLEEAVRRVRKQYGGRIISAETRGSAGNRVHVIKVLTDGGRVQTVRIRAN